jgi:hypothetical protein
MDAASWAPVSGVLLLATPELALRELGADVISVADEDPEPRPPVKKARPMGIIKPACRPPLPPPLPPRCPVPEEFSLFINSFLTLI